MWYFHVGLNVKKSYLIENKYGQSPPGSHAPCCFPTKPCRTSIQPNGHFPRIKADKSNTLEGNFVQRNQNHVHFREYSKI